VIDRDLGIIELASEVLVHLTSDRDDERMPAHRSLGAITGALCRTPTICASPSAG
jgi:hypothetical protein